MLYFTKPENLNGTELRTELLDAGVEISDSKLAITVETDGSLGLDIKNEDKAKAEQIVSNHNGTIVAPEPTVEDKLASVGLSLTDLKSALGLE